MDGRNVGKKPSNTFFYLQLMQKKIALKGILKFTLKQLPHNFMFF